MAGYKLTAKQQRFIDEYMVDFCAAKAAIRSGYSKKRADAIGYENLRKPEIQKAIQEKQIALRDKLEITQEKVVKRLADIAFTNPKYDSKGFTGANVMAALELIGKHLGIFEKDNKQKSNITYLAPERIDKILPGREQ